MTASERKRINKREARMSRGELCFCAFGILTLILCFFFSSVAVESMSRGMRLCVSVIIPSLFPFMVLSDILVVSGGAELISRQLQKPCRFLFGIEGEGVVALVLGVLCGFPMGTRSALSLYSSGKLSKRKTEHLLCFCNGPSAAFLINAVGTTLFLSRRFGYLLYFSSVLAALCTGLVLRGYFSRGGVDEWAREDEIFEDDKGGVAQRIVGAITGSAESMISICAFVLFFSALTGVLNALLVQIGAGEVAGALLLGFFEMTGGVSAASLIPLPYSAVFVAAIVGWSGLSVHFQMIALCKQHRVSLIPYFAAKLISAALCAGLVALGIVICGGSAELFTPQDQLTIAAPVTQPEYLLSVAVIAIGLMKKRAKK